MTFGGFGWVFSSILIDEPGFIWVRSNTHYFLKENKHKTNFFLIFFPFSAKRKEEESNKLLYSRIYIPLLFATTTKHQKIQFIPQKRRNSNQKWFP